MVSSSFLVLFSAFASLALGESFNLYAYGDGIGGLPLHYADGKTHRHSSRAAVISQNAPKDAKDTDVVSFTTSNGRLIGNPNATSSDPPFSNTILYIPDSESTSHEIGFVNDTDSAPANKLINRFIWYGHFLLVENDEGELTSLFSVKESASEGEYSLLWNVTDSDEDVITVSMRSIAPSTN
ncbi:hypothetical protein BDV11DRAFT_175848 [Aspergillus similis]